jgi:KUP system potassium uptake protein
MEQTTPSASGRKLGVMAVGALGVVFGDIGTSPLYTLKTVLSLTNQSAHAHPAMGVLSLIVWTLIIITTIKYVSVAMRVDNDGEGGILALMTLLGVKRQHRPVIIAVGLFGAAFWTIGLLGIWGISKYPAVLFALSPHYAVLFLLHGGGHAFLILGGVFLCVTGAEALYADMGHFGAGPIRIAWSAVVFPCLILNYAGQVALVSSGVPIQDNIFFQLCPQPLLLPLILLATIATIIASQSIITGAFSMTRQAIQLGWMPLLTIRQTSDEGYGQIYVGAVNWTLMVVTVGLALIFQKSDNLAAAYGIAVSATMLMTTALLFIAMREIWQWSLAAAGALAGAFFVVDLSFFLANMMKVAEGGYVPLILAALVYGIMYVWHSGMDALNKRTASYRLPVADFIESLDKDQVARVPGTAVFFTRITEETPPIIRWYVKQNRALRRQVVALTVKIESVPYIRADKRIVVEELAPDFWRVITRYGFMQRVDCPRLLKNIQKQIPDLDIDDLTYFVGLESIVARRDGKGIPRWQETIFAFMERNAAHVTDYFQLPTNQVVELGRQVAL